MVKLWVRFAHVLGFAKWEALSGIKSPKMRSKIAQDVAECDPQCPPAAGPGGWKGLISGALPSLHLARKQGCGVISAKAHLVVQVTVEEQSVASRQIQVLKAGQC